MSSSDNAVKKEIPSAFTLFRPSFEAVKLNLGTLILLRFLPTVVLLLALLAWAGLHDTSLVLAWVSAVILGVVGLVFYAISTPGSTYTQLQGIKGKKVSFAEAFMFGKGFALRSFGLGLITGLIIIAGFILLIVPGIFMMRRYFLAQYALVDQDLGVRDAMEYSAKLTKGRMLAVWGLIGVNILLEVPSFIHFVGWLVSVVLIIFYSCAPAIRYRHLQKA